MKTKVEMCFYDLKHFETTWSLKTRGVLWVCILHRYLTSVPAHPLCSAFKCIKCPRENRSSSSSFGMI